MVKLQYVMSILKIYYCMKQGHGYIHTKSMSLDYKKQTASSWDEIPAGNSVKNQER
jgi:hypothetical protein